MIEKPDESKLLKPGDLKYKQDFWLALESGELAKAIAWKLRKENDPKTVLTTATGELHAFVSRLEASDGKKYRASRKDIESFSKKFEKFYEEYHYLEKVEAFLAKFPKGTEDERKFDKLNAYLWNVMFRVTEPNVEQSFKQWMVNEKRLLLGMQVHYPILFGLWSPAGGNGKSYLLECLARAMSDDHLFVLNQWADLETTAGSYLKDVFGVLYKDEIGTTKGIKDTIKSLITATEITVQCKYKEPIKLPKRFQLVCSANKPIGTRVFEDESGYQRRDGTHECWGRLFDVKDKSDLIRYFRKMFEYAPVEYKMDNLVMRQFEFDEDTIEILEKLANSPMMIDFCNTNASKALKIQPFSKICSEILGISKDAEPKKFYKLDALLEKSGCFERIKYGSVSTRYFRVVPDKLEVALSQVNMLGKENWSVGEYRKPTETKDYAQMIKEAFEYDGDDTPERTLSDVNMGAIERVQRIVKKINIAKSDKVSLDELVPKPDHPVVLPCSLFDKVEDDDDDEDEQKKSEEKKAEGETPPQSEATTQDETSQQDSLNGTALESEVSKQAETVERSETTSEASLQENDKAMPSDDVRDSSAVVSTTSEKPDFLTHETSERSEDVECV